MKDSKNKSNKGINYMFLAGGLILVGMLIVAFTQDKTKK